MCPKPAIVKSPSRPGFFPVYTTIMATIYFRFTDDFIIVQIGEQAPIECLVTSIGWPMIFRVTLARLHNTPIAPR